MLLMGAMTILSIIVGSYDLFINMDEINDTHRKAGTAVENDMAPSPEDLRLMFSTAGLDVDFLLNDEKGFFLCARRVDRRPA